MAAKKAYTLRMIYDTKAKLIFQLYLCKTPHEKGLMALTCHSPKLYRIALVEEFRVLWWRC